ncbi:hypothetical protein [Nocardia sp. NPDC050412]|uniref:hypothetical protein n=1 Tax=Nocardia sp. NPDC050412 TaxID=3364320 RepID=UPI0037BCFF7E
MVVNTLARFALTTALTLVFTGITAHSATAEHTPCTLLGTMGTPEGASDRSSVGLEVLPPADIALPAQVYFAPPPNPSTAAGPSPSVTAASS